MEETIKLRVSKDMKQSISNRANNVGLSISSYIRFLINKDIKNGKEEVESN